MGAPLADVRVALLALTWLGPWADAGGSVQGQARFEKIAGSPAAGHKLLYEWDLFVSPDHGEMVGPYRRLGAPPGQPPRGDGYYRVDGLPAGSYSLYVSQPDFFASPRVVPGVAVRDGQVTVLAIDLDVDYSTYFRKADQWTDWQPDWYQTFTARGTAVRGVSFVLAGAGRYRGRKATVTVLADNGHDDVRKWTPIGRAADASIGADSDEWVRWPSGQVPLKPGRQYAVHIHVDGGMAVYKRDKDEVSYKAGRAHGPDGRPRDFDLNVTVFTDRRGQRVTHTRRSPGPGRFEGSLSGTVWGQTFVASGTSLAAADLFAASGQRRLVLTWRIRTGGPEGKPLGPAKRTEGAYFASNTRLVGVSYGPGQVKLVPGRTYCVEVGSAGGFTPYVLEPRNAYPDGRACRGRAPTDFDLAMTIVEYQ